MHTAYANRKSGDLYDVTYSDSRDLDSDVSKSYLNSLKREYIVVVYQGNYRGEGEPIQYRL